MAPKKRHNTNSIDDVASAASPRRSQRLRPASKRAKYSNETDALDGGSQLSPGKRRKSALFRNPKLVAPSDPTSGPESDDGLSSASSDERRVIIKPHNKLAGDGDASYEDYKIHHNTLAFLVKLKENNNRPWLKSNDAEYRRSLKDWESFVGFVTDKIIELDDTIPELPPKDVVFRIYRDIRFSNDPTPYKPHYSAAWSRTGRKGPFACYYVHLEPGNAFVGGGLWHPDHQALAKLRASIDERPRWWERALMNPVFRRLFFPGVKGGLEPMKKAFAEKNKDNALKVRPKGFVAEHRDIMLLKLRNFTVSKAIEAEELTRDDAGDKIADIVHGMVGFITHLNRIVMPDPGDDSDSDA